MNFSDEIVEKAALHVAAYSKAVRANKHDIDIAKAALSSLTLADLMQVDEVRELVGDVSEYLHWRAVNKHIKGGENYLKRMRETLKPFLEAK